MLAEADFYGEDRLAADWSWGAAGRVRVAELDGAVRAGGEVFLKRQAFKTANAAGAVQAGAAYFDSPDDRCAGFGLDGRLLAGRNLSERVFVNAEAGRRIAENGCREDMAEVTFGLKGADRLFIAQVSHHGSDPGGETYVLQASRIRLSGENGRGREWGIRVKSTASEESEVYILFGLWFQGRP